MKVRLGEDCVFKDVDSIPLGKDFRAVISEAVGQCEVLLAVIGRDWLNTAGDDGKRRIDDPNDYVHIEIAAALSRHIPVIPVLVENTPMPRAADLPEPLRDLAFRNGIPVRPDPDFRHDMDRLCSQLAEYLPKGWTEPVRTWGAKYRKAGAWGLGSLVLLAIVLFLATDAFRSPRTTPPPPSNAPAPIRFWVTQLPKVPGEDAAKLFNNALGSWQAVVVTPIRKADSEKEANVVIVTSSETIADAQVGPPKPNAAPLIIRFGSTVSWTPRTFEAASARMLGHILGLTYTSTPGQMMSEQVKLETLPLTPQSEDVKRVRQIWGE